MLSPFDGAGDVPIGWLASTVEGVHVVVVLVTNPTQLLCTKIFSTPLPVLRLRFEAFEANAISSPFVEIVLVVDPWLMLGFSLIAFAGVVPLPTVGVEISVVEGPQTGFVEAFKQVSNM